MMKKRWKIRYLAVSIAMVFLLVGCSDERETQDSVQLNEWLGNYEFDEFYPPNISMEYKINIYKNDEGYFASINIDGFQTTKRIKADILGNSESIDMIFESYLSESTGDRLEKGEILLSFKKEDSEIHTYWGVIQPILPENMDSGKVYFAKVK